MPIKRERKNVKKNIDIENAILLFSIKKVKNNCSIKNVSQLREIALMVGRLVSQTVYVDAI